MFESCLSLLDPEMKFYTADDVFKVLDSNPEVTDINKHLKLKYKTDKELIDRLNFFTKIPKELLKK